MATSGKMKFIIDRLTWHRGKGPGSSIASMLLTEEGKKCCVGFFAIALGAIEEEIKNVFYLHQLPLAIRNKAEWMCEANEAGIPFMSIIGRRIYRTNDKDIPDSTRERLLIQCFKENGVDVEFIN